MDTIAVVASGEHIYVHVPFCSGKCDYCAFYSERFAADAADAYLAALAVELDQYIKESSRPAPHTIYIGGGTPSVLDPERFERLLSTVSDRISREHLEEWTVEANPGTLCEKKLAAITQAGVNSVSVGAQSFDNSVLQHVGRRHRARDTDETIAALRCAGVHNVGLDLIACLPGTDDTIWKETLARAIALSPQRMSVYALTIEPATILARKAACAAITPPDDDTVLHALAAAETTLNAAGYSRYEISNYSLPGHECAHNVACWRGVDYIGFGPGASSRRGQQRWTNRPDLTAYCAALETGSAPPRETTTLSETEDSTERLIFAFRLAEGVDADMIKGGDKTLARQRQETLARLRNDGLVLCDGTRWKLTAKGRDLADLVAEELIPGD